MNVLIDSSVWIDYFRSADQTLELDYLIDNNLVCTNDLILTELIPFLKLKHQNSLISVLKDLSNNQLSVDWDQIQDYQYRCLKSGINGVGIPDLIIAQNAIQNDCLLYSLDKHFKLISETLSLKLYN